MCGESAGWGAMWAWSTGEEVEGEDRRGEGEACWLAGPGRLEVEEVGEEQREGQVEVEGQRKEGKEVGACCHERGREEQRTRERADGGQWRFGSPSCEAQGRCSTQLMWEGSTAASGRLTSSIDTLGSCLPSLSVLWA